MVKGNRGFGRRECAFERQKCFEKPSVAVRPNDMRVHATRESVTRVCVELWILNDSAAGYVVKIHFK